MQGFNREELDLEILPNEAKKELMDFYEFLLKKYSLKREDEDIEKEILADQIQIDTRGWKLNKEEIHER